MKSKICRFLIFQFFSISITFFILSDFILSQEISNTHAYKMPKQLEIPYPKFESSSFLETETAKIFPIGWSKDGKFAWVLQHPRGESDLILYDYCVQDMVTDSIIWKNTYKFDLEKGDSLSTESLDDDPTLKYFSAVWNIKKSRFYDKLIEYNIFQGNSELLSQPILSDSDTLSVIFSKKNGINDLGQFVKELNIHILSKHRGKKRIYQKKFEGKYPIYSDIVLTGYIKSPYEQRIALLMSRLNLGFEGTQYVDYFLVGAHLLIGWQE